MVRFLEKTHLASMATAFSLIVRVPDGIIINTNNVGSIII